MWENDQLAFERLQQRRHRRAGAAAQAAAQWPAHFVAFDLLRLGTDRTRQPYQERRRALEELFTGQQLQPHGRCARPPPIRSRPPHGCSLLGGHGRPRVQTP
ncbi:hypothetical protein ACFYSF_32885 [Streptomyces canus]|uniref:ATP-dependent DNA ligase n=1 Tax=Streptomyces canus TaxID=58343 RepID=UPI00367D491E